MSAPEVVTVDIARDFSRTPGGRYARDGRWSGEALREQLLEPALDRGAALVVDLDGPLGFTSSFLEEAFGGLVRRYGPGVGPRVTLVARTHPNRVLKALAFLNDAALRAPSRAR